MHGLKRGNSGPERLTEVMRGLDHYHDAFLKAEQPQEKADALRFFNSFASHFLNLVSHFHKFTFKEVERVLHQSAMQIDTFDPREAVLAFEYLAKYAHNLLDQPWREEFYTIELSSGFFAHNIRGQLCSAEEILIAMGYDLVDNSFLRLKTMCETKKLKDVSRDCFLASQECLILSQIWQRVSDEERDYPLTTGEVFEFRRKHLGNVDTICKTLLCDIRRRKHEYNQRTIVPTERLIDYDENEHERYRRAPLPEKQEIMVQQVLKNTQGFPNRHENEHVYDAVYGGGPRNNGQLQSPLSPLSSYFSEPISKGKRDKDSERKSLSPMIPKTVPNVGSSSGASSNSGRASHFQCNGTSNFATGNYQNKRNGPDLGGTPQWRQHYYTNDTSSQDTGDVQSNARNYTTAAERNHFSAGRVNEYGSSDDQYMDENVGFVRSMAPSRPLHSENRIPPPPPERVDSQHISRRTSSQKYFPDESTSESMIREAMKYNSSVKSMAAKYPKDGINYYDSQHADRDWECDSRSSGSRVSSERDFPSDVKSVSSSEFWDTGSKNRVSDFELKSQYKDRRPNCSESEYSSHRPRNISLSRSQHNNGDLLSPSRPSARTGQKVSRSNAMDNNDYEKYSSRDFQDSISSSSSSPRTPLASGPTSDNLDVDLLLLDHKKLQKKSDKVLGRKTGSFSSSEYGRTMDVENGRRMSRDHDGIENVNDFNGRSCASRYHDGTGEGSKHVRASCKDSLKSRNESIATTNWAEKKIPEWTCHHCTFMNTNSERICEVCCKTKDFFGDTVTDDQTLMSSSSNSTPKLYSVAVSGMQKPKSSLQTVSSMINGIHDKPREIKCDKCTLLNNPMLSRCSACDTLLRVSNLH